MTTKGQHSSSLVQSLCLVCSESFSPCWKESRGSWLAWHLQPYLPKLLLTLNHRKHRRGQPKPVSRLPQRNLRLNHAHRQFLLELHCLDLSNNIPKIGPPQLMGEIESISFVVSIDFQEVWFSYETITKWKATCNHAESFVWNGRNNSVTDNDLHSGCYCY